MEDILRSPNEPETFFFLIDNIHPILENKTINL